LKDWSTTYVDQSSAGVVDPKNAELPRQTFGRDRNVHGPAPKAKPVLDVDVVRTIDARDHLPDSPVQAVDHDGTGRSGYLHGADDQAAGWIRWMDPDRGIVGIVRQRVGRVRRLYLDRRRQPVRWRHRLSGVLVELALAAAARDTRHDGHRSYEPQRGSQHRWLHDELAIGASLAVHRGQKFILSITCI
jgi:hypothetical protein